MNLRAIRKSRKLTQEQLATLAKVSQSHITRVERGGGASLETLMALAAALECEVADFFATDRSAAEQALLDEYRQLPPERQADWRRLVAALRA